MVNTQEEPSNRWILRGLRRKVGSEAGPFVDEASLRRLLRNLPGMAYRCRFDSDWTMEFVSPGCRRLTGFDAADLVESQVVSFERLIHPEDRDRVRESVAEAIEARESFGITYRIRRADGRIRWVWERGIGVVDELGDVTEIEGFIMDVTDRSELEERVEQQGRLYRAVTEQALTGVFVVVADRIQYANQRFADMVLAQGASSMTDSFFDSVHSDDRERVRAEFSTIRSGASDVARLEFRAGSIEIQAQISAIDLDGERAVVGVALDVTSQRRAERRHHEAEMMESLGRFASGIAHDFQELHATIDSAGRRLIEDTEVGQEGKALLAEIDDTVDRARKLNRRLKAFGTVMPSDDPSSGVAPLVESMLPRLRRLVGESIAVELRPTRAASSVRLDDSLLDEVVLNLVLNARDALHDGGTITITVRQGLPAPVGDAVDPAARSYVELEVRDNGKGIPPESIKRLYDPSFTTKDGRGIGLGLGTVWRIVTAAGGWVSVASRVGGGSTFTVFLPKASTH